MNQTEKKVRLSIDCSRKERRYIRLQSALYDLSMTEFVMECVHLYMQKCPLEHIPNSQTAADLKESNQCLARASFR